LAAAKALDIPPRDCVVVEDTDAGILAAKDAGMKCFLYTRYTPIGTLANRADFVFEDFSALQQRITHG
jgi:beta-phosphoglucomutase-like phosphatase (HAD superfamily)